MTENQLFRLVGVCLFVGGMVPSFWYRYKSESKGEKVPWREEGMWVMVLLRVFGLLMWLTLMTYFVYPQAIAWAQVPAPVWLRWVGVGISATMVPCLLWMFRSIGKNITQTVGIREGHELVTHGPYRWIRHPLYTFGMLNFFGYALISANWFLLLWMVLGLVMLLVRLPNEEQHLIDQFGAQYIEYKKRTGALLPRLF